MKIQRKLKRKNTNRKTHVKQNPSGLRAMPEPPTYQNIKRNNWRSMLSNR